MKKVSLRDDAIMLANLIGRNLKLFLKDGMSVFFSLLSPLIILILYILFLRDVQMDAVLGAFGNAPVDRELLETFVDNWMLAGVISVACVTVSFSAQSITIKDREDGILADLMAAPVKRGVLSAAYLISNLLITVSICAFVLAVSFVFAAGGEWTLSVGDAFSIIGWMMLSAAGAATLSTLICGALKTSAQHGAATGIMSAAIGFLTRKTRIRSGAATAPRMPVITTIATVIGTIPPACSEISIAIGVVTDFGSSEAVRASSRPKRRQSRKTLPMEVTQPARQPRRIGRKFFRSSSSWR